MYLKTLDFVVILSLPQDLKGFLILCIHFFRRRTRFCPQFIVKELPSGLSGLLLAATLAAAMSSLRSGINSISMVASIDLFQRFGIGKNYQDTLLCPWCWHWRRERSQLRSRCS